MSTRHGPRILIIGGAGFVGTNLVRRCLQEPRKPEITVFDSLDPAFQSSTANLEPLLKDIKFVRGDMRDDRAIREAVAGQDILFNCAGQTSHPISMKQPIFDAEINCIGNLKVLEAVRLHNPGARVVFVSTSTITGKAAAPIIDEDHPEQPIEIYSANKCVAEKYYGIYHAAHGLKTSIVRFANLYGPFGKSLPEFSFINYFIHVARSDQPIRIFGTGAQERNVMYIEDACDALMRVADEPRALGRPYFATGDEHLSVRDIAARIVETYGRGSIQFMEWPEERKRIDVESVRYSSRRLRAMTGWKPRFGFEQGLLRMKEQQPG